MVEKWLQIFSKKMVGMLSYLGANTPMDELSRFCDLVKPNLIGLSLSVYSNLHFLLKEITTHKNSNRYTYYNWRTGTK